jgi:hypothetical protein
MTIKKISNKSEGQEIFDLNLSAYFSCSLTAETIILPESWTRGLVKNHLI